MFGSQWIAGNPLDVLATNFSQPSALFEKFPHKDVFIADVVTTGLIAVTTCIYTGIIFGQAAGDDAKLLKKTQGVSQPCDCLVAAIARESRVLLEGLL